MPAGQDRRIERTRQLLRGALFSLIREKGFESLSVQDIIDRANVGRATFYAHFDNKNALLLSGFDDLLASLRRRQRQALAAPGQGDEDLLAFSHEMFAHAHAHRPLFHAMASQHSGTVVAQRLQALLLEVTREEVKARLADDKAGAAEALVQFLAGALFGLLTWWLEGGSRIPVDEVDGQFRRFAVPALKAARR